MGASLLEERLIREARVELSNGPGGDIQLRRIEVDPDLPARAEAAGIYVPSRKTIKLAPASGDPEAFSRVVRHELCHAVDRQHGHLGAALGLHHLADDAPGLSSVGYRNKNRLAGERFAQWCELGSYDGQLLANTHAASKDVHDAVEEVVRGVWGGWLPETDLSLANVHRRSSELGDVVGARADPETGDIVVSMEHGLDRVPFFPASNDPGSGWVCEEGVPLPDGTVATFGCATTRGQIAFDWAPLEAGTLLVHTDDGWVISEGEAWHRAVHWFAGPEDRIFGAYSAASEAGAELVIVEYDPIH